MKIQLRLIATFLAFIAMGVPTYSDAVGISPPVIEAQNILKGAEQVKTILLFRDGGTIGDVHLKIAPRGTYAHYISADTEVIIPDGKDYTEFNFTINPKDAALGSYEARLNIMEVSGASEALSGDNEVAIIKGATAIVRFQVTGEQILDYKVNNLNIYDSEIGMPLSVEYTVNNSGNVEWRPDKIILNINDAEFGDTYLTLDVPNEYIPFAPAGGIKTVKFSTDHDLKIGAYRADAIFFYENEKVAELKSQKFNIFPLGTMQQTGEITNFYTNKQGYDLGEKIKLSAIFKNEGGTTIKGVLVTELSRDGSIEDIKRSNEFAVDKNKEIEVNEFFDIFKAGEYQIKGYIEYGGRKTGSKSTAFKVVGSTISIKKSAGILSGVIGVIFLITLLYKKILLR